jgi:hypothetical protein
MQWVWLLVFLAALGLLWGAIKGTEWLIEYSRERNRVINEGKDIIRAMTEKEESEYIKELESRERVDKFVNLEEWPDDFDKASPKFRAEFDSLTGAELIDVFMQRKYENGEVERNAESAKATKSAFVKPVKPKLVVGGQPKLTPIAGKKQSKMSKKEQKVYDQVKNKTGK